MIDSTRYTRGKTSDLIFYKTGLYISYNHPIYNPLNVPIVFSTGLKVYLSFLVSKLSSVFRPQTQDFIFSLVLKSIPSFFSSQKFWPDKKLSPLILELETFLSLFYTTSSFNENFLQPFFCSRCSLTNLINK